MAPPGSALAVANDLKAHLLAAGVPQVSIELMVGRSGRWVSTGNDGGVSHVVNLGHHIASRPSASNPTPGLAVVKQGRPGIPAPLCNGYGGMDLIARIICLDWANHPGEGGPWTVDGYTVPRDGGRPYLFGWEHEGGYSTAVWDATYTNRATGARMTYREFMGRCHAGTLRWLGRPRTSHGEHKTWADLKEVGRKIDRLGYTRASGIAELTPYHGPTQEDDMQLTDPVTLSAGLRPLFGNAPVAEVGQLLAYGGVGGFDYINRGKPKLDLIIETVQNIPGVDADALAVRLTELDEISEAEAAQLQQIVQSAAVAAIASQLDAISEGVAARVPEASVDTVKTALRETLGSLDEPA